MTYFTTATSTTELSISPTTSEFTTEQDETSTGKYSTDDTFISEVTQKSISSSEQTTTDQEILTDESNINHTADFASYSITQKTDVQTTHSSSADVQTQLTETNFSENNDHSTINTTSTMQTSSKSMISRRSTQVTLNVHSVTSSENPTYSDQSTQSNDRNNGIKLFGLLAMLFYVLFNVYFLSHMINHSVLIVA